MCEMSMSTGAPAASVSLAAFMLSMNGQIAAAAPTPVTAAAAIVKKSRRVAESEVCAPIGFGCAVSAIAHLSLQPGSPRASRGEAPSARARGAGYRRRGTYTFERFRLCDILPHRRPYLLDQTDIIEAGASAKVPRTPPAAVSATGWRMSS